MTKGRRRLIWWVAAAAILLALIAIRPWVVRPLDATGAASVGPARFVASDYVGSIWAAKIMGEGVTGARPIAEATAQAGFLKGTGTVLRLDRSSQVGIALIDLAPQDGKADVKLQIGPITRGTDLRDAAGLRFADFDTQIDFANVADALRDRAINGLPVLKNADALVGRQIRFVAAGAALGGGQPELLPVKIEVLP